MFTAIQNSFLLALTQAPVPRDLDLPLPLPEVDLKIILVLVFLAHIFFVNLMVGGSIMSVLFEIIGLSSTRYDSLAKKISQTITVNKSLAVVLGVGPLLCISLAYTVHFYSANTMTGYAWISVIPLVSAAFLLSYVHKYSWDRWTGPSKRAHIAVGISAAILFLCIPLIFLTNINLMLFPDQWPSVKGFFSSLRVGNVFPRLFHFLAASLALTGLFLAGWFSRKAYPLERELPEFTHGELKKLFYRIAFHVSLAQLFFGPFLLFTLPAPGVTSTLLWLVLLGIGIVVIFLYVLGREIQSEDAYPGKKYVLVVLILSAVVLTMGTVRHVYREASIEPHRKLVRDRSDTFHAIETATQIRLAAGLGAGEAIGGGPTGESVFRNCAACHALDRVLAGPSLVEISTIYKNNPSGIRDWAKAPGKKRPEFAAMPSFAHLGDEQLLLVAEYILATASGEPAPPSQSNDNLE